MIGGAPVSQEWSDAIGADGCAEDAVGAVALAKRLVKGRNDATRSVTQQTRL